MANITLSTDSSVSSVPVSPDFILYERGYAENSVQYDPDTGVLTVLRDRLTELGDVQLVLPVEVDGHVVSVDLDDGSQVEASGDTLVLPRLAMYAELPGTIVFTPPPSSEAKPPPVKVKISIRVRPTGGG